MQNHVYDVSHCLTQGIKIRKLNQAVDPQGVKGSVWYSGKWDKTRIPAADWYFTKEQATAVANDRRRRAIEAAKRKIAKLKAITFDDCPILPVDD